MNRLPIWMGLKDEVIWESNYFQIGVLPLAHVYWQVTDPTVIHKIQENYMVLEMWSLVLRLRMLVV